MKTRLKLNLRFLLCVLIGTAVLGIGVHFVHGYQVKRNAIALLHQADKAKENAEKAKEAADKAKEKKDAALEKQYRAKEQEHLATEMQYLVRYLGLVPRDIDALARHGEALDDVAKKTDRPRTRLEAFRRLENVLRLDPSRDAIRRRQVDSAIYFRRYSDALEHLKVLHEAKPKDAELLRLRGFCEAAKGNFANAVKEYEKAIKNAPDQIDNYWSLAVLYRDRLKQPEEADKQLKAMVEQGKPEFRAYLRRAQYYLQFESKDSKKLELATKDVERARKLEPNEPDVVLAAAEVDRAQGNPDAARQTLHQGIQSHPRDARLYYALISLEVREDKIKPALVLARQGEKDLRDLPEDAPGKSDLLHALADLLVQDGDLTEAQGIIAQLDKNPKFPKSFLDYLRARILVRENQWSEASKLLDTVHPKLAGAPNLQAQALLLLGQCFEQLGNPDQAMLDYRQARQLDPLSVAIHYRIGALHVAQGRTGEALEEYSNIIKAPKIPVGLHLVMARTLIAHNQSLPPAARKLEDIRRALDSAEKEDSKSAELPIMRAQLVLLKDPKQVAKAREIILDAREKNPDEVSLWIAEAQLVGSPEALGILDKARQRSNLGDNVELFLAQLSYRMQAPAEQTPEQQKITAKKQRAVLDRMEQDAKKLTDETSQARLFSGLAEAYLNLGEAAEAERLWSQVAQKQPKNLGVRMVLFDLSLQKKNLEAMNRFLEEMHRIEGDNGVYWRYATASRLIQEAAPEEKKELSDSSRRLLSEARQYLVEAAQRRPSWYRITTLEAGIDILEGKANAAIEKFQHALEQGERRPDIVRKAVQLMFEHGKGEDAIKAVRKLLNRSDLLLAAGLGKLAAESLLTGSEANKSDVAQALKFASRAVRSDSKEYKDHLWLGRVQWAAGELADAEKSLRKACELAGNVAENWMTLVAFYAGAGRKEDAEKSIGQATKKLAADQASLGLAACYETIGDLKKAEENYRAAVKAAPQEVRLQRLLAAFYLKHGQLSEAEQILRALLSREDKLTDDDAMWARRSLAAVLAASKERSQFEKALELVETNLKKNESSLPDKHAKALLLATRISKREQAIRLFEELDRSSSLSANELFTLVQLYMSDNDWEKAHARMMILLSRPEGKNPTFEAFFARTLLDHGDIRQAELLLEQLKTTLTADAPVSREIEARILQARKKDGDAIKVVRAYADSKDGDLVRAAELLKSLGDRSQTRDRNLPATERNTAWKLYLDAAEELYRQYVKKGNKPERFLTLAAFLGTRHQVAEALDLCKEAEQNNAAPEAVAPVLTNAIRFAPSRVEHGRRVEEWLKKMLANKPGSVRFLICLADLYDLLERFAEAEKMYRISLSKNPGDVMVLNNLAWLLAFKDSPAREEALAAINQAINRVGEGPELLDTRGIVLLMMGQTEKAVQDLQAVVARDPAPNHCFHLVRALAAANKWNEAEKVFAEAERLGFDVQQLHPLERKIGKRLTDELHELRKRGPKVARNP